MIYFTLCVQVFSLHVYIGTMYFSGSHGGEKQECRIPSVVTVNP